MCKEHDFWPQDKEYLRVYPKVQIMIDSSHPMENPSALRLYRHTKNDPMICKLTGPGDDHGGILTHLLGYRMYVLQRNLAIAGGGLTGHTRPRRSAATVYCSVAILRLFIYSRVKLLI